jgi:DNA-binding MarR family transcriptional regulator
MTTLQSDEVFNILTGKISGAINRKFLRTFSNEGIDITTEQWSVMACLWKEDNVTQQVLCTLTSKDKPSMTRLLDKLENSKLVTRVADPLDRRINLIQLTADGRKLEQKASELVNNITTKTLRDISEEEMETVRVVLKKIMANLL